MSDQTLSAAKASATPNKGAEEGSIINGRILVWMDGFLQHASPAATWNEWLWLATSPLPETQARARVLRAALDRIGHLQ